MHHNALFFLSLAIPSLIAAQKDGQAYCDIWKKAPNKNACADIKNNGVKESEYYKRTEWWSGNCRVEVSTDVGTGSGSSIKGDVVKRAIQNVLDTCDSGFQYVGGVRVEVNLCMVGNGNIMNECKGPLQKVSGFTKRDAANTRSNRRHLTDISSVQSANPDNVFPRATEPYEGIICGGGPGSTFVDACKETAEAVKNMGHIDLPFIYDKADCQLQVWPTTRNKKSTETSHVSYSMTEDVDLCADAKGLTVGFIQNYLGYDYHFFFGQPCGALKSGRAGSCFPGGK